MRVRLRNPDREIELHAPTTVGSVLDELDINPTTVLVIRDGELLPAQTQLTTADTIEIRPVISGGSGAPRCIVCRDPAVIEEPRHRSAWCGAHLVDHVRRQIRKAIDAEQMLSYKDRVLVAVSGGKDSLALWDALLAMGYQVDGLYIGLGIGGYSRRSEAVCRAFAAEREAELRLVDVATSYGYTVPQAGESGARPTCGICGLSKRYVFNREAVDGGYDVVATGHNLDDEAATLLGNVLRWQERFLARQRPALPATGPNQVRKVKPLYRLSERETAAYCVVRAIDYVVEECPLVEGNTGLELKEALSAIERHAPGTKAQFLFGFLDRYADRFERQDTPPELADCPDCGMPTQPADDGNMRRCAFCRQRDRILTARGAT